jgi:hypothetical protein
MSAEIILLMYLVYVFKVDSDFTMNKVAGEIDQQKVGHT